LPFSGLPNVVATSGVVAVPGDLHAELDAQGNALVV